MRTTSLFNDNWYFSRSDNANAKDVLFNQSSYQRIQLPHDWSVETCFEKESVSGMKAAYLQTGIGWYRKTFNVDEKDLGKRFEIYFEGVFTNSLVYVNGELVGNRPYGYISFFYDISKYLKAGKNLIAVRADCSKPDQSRWYNGSGIYRDVWLDVTEKIYAQRWGTSVVSHVNDNNADISYVLNLVNEKEQKTNLEIKTRIETKAKEVVASVSDSLEIDETATYEATLLIENVKIWDTQSPNLYNIISDVYENGVLIDSITTKFGVRTLEFKSNEGMFLNGVHTNLKGVCLHHDGGIVGAAVPRTIVEKRIKLLKEMGCNAVRTAHNPQSPEFYDVCDELGMMVMDELFDGWETAKGANDYGLFFKEWHEKDATDFINRDRNHPSIVLWSIGNEVTKMTTATSQELIDLFHRLDPTRLVTNGVQSIGENNEANRALLDIAGYNDGGGSCFTYEAIHEKRPNQLFVATEAPHTGQTRGFYRTQTWWRDKNQARIEIPNLVEEEIFFDGSLEYQSSYDNSGVRVCTRDSWSLVEKFPYLIGEFRWSGIDYYGESKWPKRKSESGVIDTANFPKDHFYLYQSMWSDPLTKPMVHLLPHWTHPRLEKGTIVPIWVYTNCQEAELFLNGESLGKQTKGNAKHLQWDVPYVEGEMKAVSYMNGEVVAEKSFKTAKEPSKLLLTSDTETPIFDGKSTVQIDICATDDAGTMVPYAENITYVNVFGNAKLIGTENGDTLDTTLLQSPKRKFFNGLTSAVIVPCTKEGDISVTVSAILGDRVFKESTVVSVDVKTLFLNCEEKAENFKIYYTNDGTLPDNSSIEYKSAFEISETTQLSVAVYKDDVLMNTFEEFFVKGEYEKVIDLIHGNKQLSFDKPIGPFAEEIIGLWAQNEGFKFEFTADGKLLRYVTNDNVQYIGDWWYDYPSDTFEVEDYAGKGEIWFISGEKEEIALTTQAATELILDNEQRGMDHAPNTIKFTKI